MSCNCPPQNVTDMLYMVWRLGWPIDPVIFVALEKLFEQKSLVWPRDIVLKGEHRTPRPHIYTSNQLQSLCQRRGEVSSHPTWCLPSPLLRHRHNWWFHWHWRVGSGSPALSVWKYGKNRRLGWNSNHRWTERSPIVPYSNHYAVCTMLISLAFSQTWTGRKQPVF